MAEETVAEQYDDKAEERRLLALNALWEIEELADTLGRYADAPDTQDLLVRSLSARLLQLSRVGMSALDGAVSELSDLARDLKPFRPTGAAA